VPPLKRGAADADAVAAGFDCGKVLGDAGAAGFVRVHAQFDLVAEQLARLLEGFMHLARVGCAGGVLEADAGEGHAGVENLAQGLGVELGIVRAGAAARQFHHGHDDFVFESGVGDALTGVDEVIDVVQRVEVADARHAVLFEHLGVQVDHVGRLLFEGDDVDAARQRLQADIRADRLAEGVHHVEGGFAAVQERRLEACAAARFEVRDASRHRSFDGGDEVLGQRARTEDGLEAITKTGVLEEDFLGHHVAPESL
jgi:hypothetical protein